MDASAPLGIDQDIAAQFAAMGSPVPPDVLSDQTPDPEEFHVFSANWPTVLAFIACETQWRTAGALAGMIWLGLDYGAVDVVLNRLCPEASFHDIRVMEREALQVFAEDR